MKSPPLRHYPLMIALAVTAIIVVGWIVNQVFEMNGG